jgi:hypothetical protein
MKHVPQVSYVGGIIDETILKISLNSTGIISQIFDQVSAGEFFYFEISICYCPQTS